MDEYTLTVKILVFMVAGSTIGYFGVCMTRVARQLAYETGMGEAVMGTVFIGASTSLSGITASITAAAQGHAELAVSNSLGGIAAQTLFLAVADMFYRKANLEHAAASAENLLMSAFLIVLLTIPLAAYTVPDISVLAVHPASILAIGAYIFGVYVLSRTHEMPMWFPKHTPDTRLEAEPSKKHKRIAKGILWMKFLVYSVVVGIAGWVLGSTGIAIAADTGLSEGIIGGVFIAVSTSLPELVIAVSAVRMGALTLAVGDIIGGNTFDTLFIAASDIAYRQGPIYRDISSNEVFWIALSMLMTGVLLMGLIHRERHGIANIGMESFLVIVLYISGLTILIFR
jgi:cation:H+ antiporter